MSNQREEQSAFIGFLSKAAGQIQKTITHPSDVIILVVQKDIGGCSFVGTNTYHKEMSPGLLIERLKELELSDNDNGIFRAGGPIDENMADA